MNTSRPYRIAMPPERVDADPPRGAGTQWDPLVIDAYVRCRDRLIAIRQRGLGESLKSHSTAPSATEGAMTTLAAKRCPSSTHRGERVGIGVVLRVGSSSSGLDHGLVRETPEISPRQGRFARRLILTRSVSEEIADGILADASG